ncbi:MAG: efflux RND transporter periplasmic adaptor subunit [Vicinamibacterales bacterium]
MHRRSLTALAGVMAIAGALLAAKLSGTSEEQHGLGDDTRPPIAVNVETARVSDVPDEFELGGSVRARAVATIVSRIVGEIRAVRAVPGDRVHAGAPLVVLDSREVASVESRMRASLEAARQAAALARFEREAAEAGVELARSTHRRIAELHSRKSATPHELDQAVAGLRAAEARLASAEARELEARAQIEAAAAGAEAARVNVSYSIVSAPFDGIVTEKLVDAGNTATPGMPLLTLEDVRSFRLEVFVDESRVGLIEPGQGVRVRLDASPGESLAGRVAEVAHVLDHTAHAFLVRIDLPEGARLQSGMFGRARFTGRARRALVVPASSLVRRGQLISVFVVDAGNRARMRLVTAADPAGEAVEVRAGLAEGEQVVVAPPQTLFDGTPVASRKGR